MGDRTPVDLLNLDRNTENVSYFIIVTTRYKALKVKLDFWVFALHGLNLNLGSALLM